MNKALFAVFLLTVLLSLAHSFYFKIDPSVDADAYESYASEIAAGRGYPVGAIGRPGPGYEYFLAIIYYFFGRSHEAVWIIQAILLGLSTLAVYFLTKLVFKNLWHPLIGLASMAFVGLSPDFIVLSSMLMTETLSVFLTAVFLLCFFKNYWNPRWYL